MTMESRQPEAAGSGSGLMRSAAPSPADLWNEILQRLSEVQEGQLRLARAIESLGMIVCDALAVNPQAMLAGSETTSLPRTPRRVSLAAGPVAPVASGSDLAATERTLDSLLAADVFVPAGPGPDPDQNAAVAAAAAPGSVSSPRFFVAPVPAENRNAARQPVPSGSWPRGRRVARGLGRETPGMSTPAVVPNLTPAAIDALLAAEFGESPAKATPGAVQAAEGAGVLNSLLGSEFGAAGMPSSPTNTPPPTNAPPSTHTTPHAGPPPGPSALRPPASPPPGTPTPPPAMPTGARPPQTTGRTSAPASPTRQPAGPPPGASWAPTVDPRRPAGATSPGAAPPAPAAPPAMSRPTPGPGGPLLPPPMASPPRPPAVAPTGPPAGPSVVAPAPPGPHRSPLDAATPNPAPFVSPGAAVPDSSLNASSSPADSGGAPHADAEGMPTAKPGDSAASMATEILSASPRLPVVEQTESAPTTLAEDVTIMAKGRRRRFRLR